MPIVGQFLVFTVKPFLSHSLILLSLADIFLLLAYFYLFSFGLFSFCLCAVVFFAIIVFVVMNTAFVLALVVVLISKIESSCFT